MGMILCRKGIQNFRHQKLLQLLFYQYLLHVITLTADVKTVGRIVNAYTLEIELFYGSIGIVDTYFVDGCCGADNLKLGDGDAVALCED